MAEYREEDEGIHFDPPEVDLIRKFLIPKLKGVPCEDNIAMKDVYAKEPWLLDHTKGPFFMEDQWFYFVTRTQISDKKTGCGKYAKRTITGDNSNDGIDRGSWTATKKEEIVDEKTQKVVGFKQRLTFKKSKHKNKKKKQKIGDGSCVSVPGSDSSWTMKEYTLPQVDDQFQSLVLCRIKEKKKSKKEDDDDHDHDQASTSTCTYNHHLESCYTEQQAISNQPNQVHIDAPTGSEQEAGKNEDWIQEFANELLAQIESTLEENQDLIFYEPQPL